MKEWDSKNIKNNCVFTLNFLIEPGETEYQFSATTGSNPASLANSTKNCFLFCSFFQWPSVVELENAGERGKKRHTFYIDKFMELKLNIRKQLRECP